MTWCHHEPNTLIQKGPSNTGRQIAQCKFIHLYVFLVIENNSIRSADGTIIVNRSIELQEPVIYVNFNYR